jgi:hypothetical protein
MTATTHPDTKLDEDEDDSEKISRKLHKMEMELQQSVTGLKRSLAKTKKASATLLNFIQECKNDGAPVISKVPQDTKPQAKHQSWSSSDEDSEYEIESDCSVYPQRPIPIPLAVPSPIKLKKREYSSSSSTKDPSAPKQQKLKDKSSPDMAKIKPVKILKKKPKY